MTSEKEVWKPVPGWDGEYEVSSQGRVRSIDRQIIRSDGVIQRVKGKMLVPTKKKRTGHHWIRLMKNSAGEPRYVHRLVLEAFVGPCPDGMVGCHEDDDPDNNHLENLRWDTISQNNYDMVRNGNHNFASRDACKRGHPLSGENLIEQGKGDGWRGCLACHRARGYVSYHPELRPHLQSVSDSYFEAIEKYGSKYRHRQSASYAERNQE